MMPDPRLSLNGNPSAKIGGEVMALDLGSLVDFHLCLRHTLLSVLSDLEPISSTRTGAESLWSSVAQQS
ncbi:unnamed protein product [Sphenostylis stenocarpa]|uniref:Uncharacterized protein n=1 Tax=Sphenostylis stenocarpa TaxID=92480 RepID=A0AA86VQ01_9FABA|nr:unnamed protein product [Sphenostylis stenocarpa]